MTRKLLSLLLMLALSAAMAVAHGGKSHRLLGTVKAVAVESLVVTTQDGRDVTVALPPATRYEKAGEPASRADLTAGVRVSVQLTEDDATATVVKIAAAAPR